MPITLGEKIEATLVQWFGHDEPAKTLYRPLLQALLEPLNTEAQRYFNSWCEEENRAVALEAELERLQEQHARQALTIHEKTEAWREAWEENKKLRAEKVVAVTARCKECGAYCDDIQFEYAKPQP